MKRYTLTRAMILIALTAVVLTLPAPAPIEVSHAGAIENGPDGLRIQVEILVPDGRVHGPLGAAIRAGSSVHRGVVVTRVLWRSARCVAGHLIRRVRVALFSGSEHASERTSPRKAPAC